MIRVDYCAVISAVGLCGNVTRTLERFGHTPISIGSGTAGANRPAGPGNKEEEEKGTIILLYYNNYMILIYY